MPATPNSIRVITIFAVMLLLAAACGSEGSAIDNIATLEDGPDDLSGVVEPAPGENDIEAPEDPEDAFALFEECMDDAGFDFGSNGGFVGGGLSIEAVDGDQPHEIDPQTAARSIGDFDFDDFEAANEQCESHLANIDGGFDLSPEQQAAFDDAQLEWNTCMSDQGIEIPDLGGNLSGGSGITVVEADSVEIDPQGGIAIDDLDFDFSAFEEAAEACQAVYEQFDELDGLFDESDQ